MNLFNRSSGTLLHVSSLPSKYGIGDFSKQAYKFVDILNNSKITLWQILPLCPPGAGNSPYASISSYAGNPLLISLESLVNENLLTKEEFK